MNQSAGDCDTLLLTPGELMDQPVGEIFHFDPAQPVEGTRARIRLAGEQQRQLDVFHGGQRVQQLKRLKNETDLFPPQPRQFAIVESGCALASKQHFARGRKVHRSGEMQKGRFAAAAFTRESDELALLERQGDVFERCHRLACRSINFSDVSQLEPRHLLSGSYAAICHSSATLGVVAKILVTGGAGYIGSVTRYALEKRGHEPVVADNLSRGHREAVPEGMLRVVDTRDKAAVRKLLEEERIDAVIHFAAYLLVGESTQRPEIYFENNVGGSISLFEAMLEAGVKYVVFSSTAAAYGISRRVPIPESEPLAPINPYGESKIMVEKVLAWLDRYRDFRSVCLRYFNACGAEPEAGLGERHEPETHLIPLILRAVQTGNPVTVFGDDYDTPDGTCIRDYIHVSDLAHSHILAVENLLAGGESNIFNVGTGEGHSVKEVIAAVERVTGKKVPFTVGPRREGDPPAGCRSHPA
jgi:UDP-glucose 4-epimerase